MAKLEHSLERTDAAERADAERQIVETYIERLKIGAELNRLRAEQIRIALNAKINYGETGGHCW